MDLSKFRNRTKELLFFKDDIDKYSKNKRIVVLKSPKGWGKSSLIKKVRFELTNSRKIIHCNIPENFHNSKNNGYYIKEIASSIDLSKEVNEDGLNYFLNNYEKTNDLINAGLKDLSNIVPNIKNTVEFFSDSFTDDQYIADKILSGDIPEYTSLLQKYIQDSIVKHNLVLFIENIHYIDLQSLEFLRYLLKKQHVYIILEYNENLSDAHSLELLNSHFDLQEYNLKNYSLPLFPEDELTKILSKDQDLLKSYIMHVYKYNKGDLRVLDFIENEKIMVLDKTEITNTETLYLESISHLNSHDKYILVLIGVHINGADIEDLENEILFHASFSSSNRTLQETIKKLLKKDLIFSKLSKVFVKDSIISDYIMKNNSFVAQRMIANQLWQKFYQYEWDYNTNIFRQKSETLYNLLYFSSQLNDQEKIKFVLNELYNNINNNFNKFLYLLNTMQKTMLNNSIMSEKLNLTLLKTYYILERIDESFEILNNIDKTSNKFIAYKSILLYRQGDLNESIDFCNKTLKNVHSSNLKLFLMNVKMICYRNLNQIDKAEIIFNTIIENKEYHNLYEYGYTLRNSQMIFTAHKAMSFIEQSVNHFKLNMDKQQEGFSCIALSVLKARDGNFSESKRLLNDTLILFKNIFIAKHTIYNNFAVLKILESQYDNEAKSFIKKAIYTVDNKTPFAHIVILINSLIINIETMNFDVCNDIIDSIILALETTVIKDPETLRMIYYNISIYYQTIGSQQLADDYIIKLKELGTLTTFWMYKLNNDINIKSEKVMLQHKYRPIFLTHWFMDINENL